jgi:hypothetical protein
MLGKEKIIRWSPRVSREVINRLYQTDARGIVDEELIDKVGIAFLVRCESIRRVTERCCPECGSAMNDPGPADKKSRIVSCTKCMWSATWHQYHSSYKPDRLHGGRAFVAFLECLREYPKCRSPRDKMLRIDLLVHALHESGLSASPAAQNVIQGSYNVVKQFLNDLAYGDTARQLRPGIRDHFEKRAKESAIASEEFWRRKREEREAAAKLPDPKQP